MSYAEGQGTKKTPKKYGSFWCVRRCIFLVQEVSQRDYPVSTERRPHGEKCALFLKNSDFLTFFEDHPTTRTLEQMYENAEKKYFSRTQDKNLAPRWQVVRQNQKAYKNKKQLVNTKASPSLTNPAGDAHESYCKFFFPPNFCIFKQKSRFLPALACSAWLCSCVTEKNG